MFPHNTTKHEMERALRRAEIKIRVGATSVDEMRKILEDVIEMVVIEAHTFSGHAGRETLRKEDIEIAIKTTGVLDSYAHKRK